MTKVIAVLHQGDSGACRPLTVIPFIDRDRQGDSWCHVFVLPFLDTLASFRKDLSVTSCSVP